VPRWISFALLLCLPRAHAETAAVSEDQVKAAFVYNFAKFVEWPAGTFRNAQEPIVVGVVKVRPIIVGVDDVETFARILDETLQGKSIQGHPLSVKHFSAVQIEPCQILVVPESTSIAQILSGLGSAATLTVGNGSSFTTAGGMIAFAVEDRRVRFDINLGALRKARLRPSSQLLKVARVVSGAAPEDASP
jgi:hypothetical protein